MKKILIVFLFFGNMVESSQLPLSLTTNSPINSTKESLLGLAGCGAAFYSYKALNTKIKSDEFQLKYRGTKKYIFFDGFCTASKLGSILGSVFYTSSLVTNLFGLTRASQFLQDYKLPFVYGSVGVTAFAAAYTMHTRSQVNKVTNAPDFNPKFYDQTTTENQALIKQNQQEYKVQANQYKSHDEHTQHIASISTPKFLNQAISDLEQKYDLPKGLLKYVTDQYLIKIIPFLPIVATYTFGNNKEKRITFLGARHSQQLSTEIMIKTLEKIEPDCIIKEDAQICRFLVQKTKTLGTCHVADPANINNLLAEPSAINEVITEYLSFQNGSSKIIYADPPLDEHIKTMESLGLTLDDILRYRYHNNNNIEHFAELGYQKATTIPNQSECKNVGRIDILSRDAFILNFLKNKSKTCNNIFINFGPAHWMNQQDVLAHWFGKPTITIYPEQNIEKPLQVDSIESYLGNQKKA